MPGYQILASGKAWLVRWVRSREIARLHKQLDDLEERVLDLLADVYWKQEARR